MKKILSKIMELFRKMRRRHYQKEFEEWQKGEKDTAERTQQNKWLMRDTYPWQ
ncbi:MAG: hypothetical protein IK088_02345 [Lachnospiraceae bacterium]|nr:hypothetical protein [Lachnospiraceae bacterium]